MRRDRHLFSRGLAVSCVVALLCCRWCAADNPSPAQEIKTEHYDLYVEGTDGKEVGQLVEDLYGELKLFFHAEPDCRLRVRIVPNKQRLEEALDADFAIRIINTEAGLYSPQTKTAYLYVEPADHYVTRARIRHECTHQFHFLARTGNIGARSSYYSEGLAEHFGFHCWDGQAAQAAKIPDIMALRAFKYRHHGSFKELATDAEGPDPYGYCEAWGLVSFLIADEHDRFQKWARALDAGREPAKAWEVAFADRSDEQLSRNYVSWLIAHQEPWQGLRGNWQSTTAGRLDGSAEPTDWATAVVRPPVETLRFSARATKPGALLGIIAASDSILQPKEACLIMEVTARGSVFVCSDHLHWTLADLDMVKDPRKFEVEVRCHGTGFEVYIDGSFAVVLPDSTLVGPAVYNGSATFSNIEVVAGKTIPRDEAPPAVAAPKPSPAPLAAGSPPSQWPRARDATPSVPQTMPSHERWAGAAVLVAIVGLAWWQRKRRRA